MFQGVLGAVCFCTLKYSVKISGEQRNRRFPERIDLENPKSKIPSSCLPAGRQEDELSRHPEFPFPDFLQ
jgi:hypothetical protein